MSGIDQRPLSKDLYVVLLIIFIIEQIPGNDLLHDMTRKAARGSAARGPPCARRF